MQSEAVQFSHHVVLLEYKETNCSLFLSVLFLFSSPSLFLYEGKWILIYKGSRVSYVDTA